MPEWGILVFSIFLLFFSEFSSTGVRTEFRPKIFFPSFSVYLIPFWLKLMRKRGFLIFSIFLVFFSEFSSPGYEWKSGQKKFFLSFSAYLIPFWLKIMPERGFWIFLQYLFRNFLASVKYERNSGLKFFSLFFGLSHPVLAKNNAGKRFFIFSIFLLFFFWNFLPRARYERNSRLKYVFSLVWPISSHFG